MQKETTARGKRFECSGDGPGTHIECTFSTNSELRAFRHFERTGHYIDKGHLAIAQYEILTQNDAGEWTNDGIGEPNVFDTADEAWEAVGQIRTLGEEWAVKYCVGSVWPGSRPPSGGHPRRQ